ncbi:hypothetical protein ABW20_dc0103788 [Dactylellina cionopaga]|nr:hypothetical protein ABW20_dc0103788 [Dactylellina cionopaga]
MGRRKQSDKSRSSSKAAAAAAGHRVSISTKSQPPPPSPKTPKGESASTIKENPISPAAPMIKRRSAYVAGGGIKTTDLALPKPEVVELPAPPPEHLATTPVDPELILTLNKPRKRNKANPSVLRMREKEVDEAMPDNLDDPDGQLVREMFEAENRQSVESEDGKEGRNRMKMAREESKEPEAPPKPGRRKRRVKSKAEIEDDEDEEMDEAPPPPPPAKRGRRAKQVEAAPVESQEEATEEEAPPTAILGKRTRKATTRAIKAAEQFPKRRRTRRADADEADAQTDYVSATSGTESIAPEPPVPPKKPGRRGRKPAVKDEKKVVVEETASEAESISEPAPPAQLIVNGQPIRLPTPPPGFKKPGLVGWYRVRERPKFTEASEFLDTEHTIRRLKDRERLHHLKTSVTFFEMPTLAGEDGWTDTEQELEKMGKSKPADSKLHKTALWDSQISDAAFEKGFEQLERKGSVEPLSAAETPKNEFPPDVAPIRQLTGLSHMENLKYDDVGTPMDETVPPTAVATPMAELEMDGFPMKIDKATESAEPTSAFVPPTHAMGFSGMIGDSAPKQETYKHTERKRKVKIAQPETDAKNLKGVKWIVPHFEGRSKEILKQTFDLQAERRKEREKVEAEAQAALAEESKVDKLKPKRGGRRGKKKTKGDLKNLAYAREVRRAKLEGARIHTPDDDNLSIVSGSLGDGGNDAASDVTMDDDLSENSDHSSDWSLEEMEDEQTPEQIEMERKYQEAMADPATEAFFREWGAKLFPTIYELPEDGTRNRGPDYTNAEELGRAIDTALEIDDQDLLQAVMAHTTMQYAMVTDEKIKLDTYQVKRGFIKPEALLRRAQKRKADDAGLDEGEDGPGPRYSTRRRTVKNPDADDQIGLTGYSTPRLATSGSFLQGQDGHAQTPEREVRVYKPRGGRGRGRGRGAASVAKAEAGKPTTPSAPGEVATGTGSRGGRGRGGRGRGRGRGRHVT